MKRQISDFAYLVGRRVFKPHELQLAYRKLHDPALVMPSPMSHLAYIALKGYRTFAPVDDLAERYLDTDVNPLAKLAPPNAPSKYDAEYLHHVLNRIYDMPQVEIDPTRPRTINVLVPAFEFRSMSAGFFGVFEVARFMKRCGYNVRCVMFDNFYYNEAEFREKFKDYPGMEDIYDCLEIEYIGERRSPLRVNPGDVCLATVWYSAHFANKIMSALGHRPFIYLIQDYETNFFAGGTHWTQAENTYDFNYHALYSTKSLMDYCTSRGIDKSISRGNKSIYFNNACSANLMPRDDFLRVNGAKQKRDLVFYSRPVVNRNMFELGALALIEACRQGILPTEDWNFWSVGLGDGEIVLSKDVSVKQLPRMTLKDYLAAIGRFDMGLTLMASPHPSLLPMDLAGSGCICVTNTLATKTPEYLTGISSNILAAPPDLSSLLEALRVGARRVKDLEARYGAAAAMNYPRNWTQTFGDEHRDFVDQIMRREH